MKVTIMHLLNLKSRNRRSKNKLRFLNTVNVLKFHTAKFPIMAYANGADPDQTPPNGGYTLFSISLNIFFFYIL